MAAFELANYKVPRPFFLTDEALLLLVTGRAPLDEYLEEYENRALEEDDYADTYREMCREDRRKAILGLCLRCGEPAKEAFCDPCFEHLYLVADDDLTAYGGVAW